MAEALSYLVLAAVLAVALRYGLRSARRANAAAPPEARRSLRQRALHFASALLPLLAVGYFAFFNERLLLASIALSSVFIAIMLGLRFLGIPWRTRLLVCPLAAEVAFYAGAMWAAIPSLEPSSLAPGVLVALSTAAVAWCVSWVLSLFSFPLGYGERSV